MKRAYPTIKFVPPRSTSGGKNKAGSAAKWDTAPDGYTPPVRATVTVSPALATAKKRKRPTTQSWKGPRRRLDPPSPSKAQKAGGSGPPQAKIDGFCTKLDDEPAGSTSSGACSRAAHRTATVAAHAEKPCRATSATGCANTDALVMAAETPARLRHRGLPSFSRCSEATATAAADIDQRKWIGTLRVPDTPDPPKVEERRAAQGGAKRKDADSVSDSYSSSLSSPSVGLRDKDERDWENGELTGIGVRAVRVAAASAPAVASAPASALTASGPVAPRSSGYSDDGSEPESPDLLRSYTMEATARSQDQGSGGGTGGGGTGSVEGVSRSEAAGEESDTGSDSPDLLATYARIDAGAVLGMGAADEALTSCLSECDAVTFFTARAGIMLPSLEPSQCS